MKILAGIFFLSSVIGSALVAIETIGSYFVDNLAIYPWYETLVAMSIAVGVAALFFAVFLFIPIVGGLIISKRPPTKPLYWGTAFIIIGLLVLFV
ncbi:MAG: hypothetical protein UY09_C0012G0038 [Parcubacteria group bacterium GW2011_GWA2_47_8]|nr:MAG: hypothetical protein UY09_C0012G0038 [Parcubacteria group bacterium GW2011_GWA2_47_8]OHB20866.1 MAG: hypothetical protein A2666_04430 [Parcubacteria group bacterium RIFCSPHIGHO2_01_FULL_47_10b]